MVLYIHGAGWVFGNAHTHDRLVRELAVGTGAAVVFPEYRRSPEARYPTAPIAVMGARDVRGFAATGDHHQPDRATPFDNLIQRAETFP